MIPNRFVSHKVAFAEAPVKLFRINDLQMIAYVIVVEQVDMHWYDLREFSFRSSISPRTTELMRNSKSLFDIHLDFININQLWVQLGEKALWKLNIEDYLGIFLDCFPFNTLGVTVTWSFPNINTLVSNIQCECFLERELFLFCCSEKLSDGEILSRRDWCCEDLGLWFDPGWRSRIQHLDQLGATTA